MKRQGKITTRRAGKPRPATPPSPQATAASQADADGDRDRLLTPAGCSELTAAAAALRTALALARVLRETISLPPCESSSHLIIGCVGVVGSKVLVESCERAAAALVRCAHRSVHPLLSSADLTGLRFSLPAEQKQREAS